MKRIISVIIALCLTASLVAGFAMGTNAEVADKRVLPRAEKAPTLDGKRDAMYDKGFRETLNIDTAGMVVSEEEDFDTGKPTPKFTPASADISAVMGISIRQAQYTLNMFDQRGQTVRNGRKKMVDLNIFSRFLSEQDGADLRERKRDIQEFLQEAKKEAAG